MEISTLQIPGIITEIHAGSISLRGNDLTPHKFFEIGRLANKLVESNRTKKIKEKLFIRLVLNTGAIIKLWISPKSFSMSTEGREIELP